MARAERLAEGESERTCVVTRAVRPPAEMLRFVLGPDDEVVPDLKRNLPGRGVWVTADAASVATAVERQLFTRSFKTKVRASSTLAQEVDQLLERQALQSMSIVNKAGLVVTGAAKVEKAIAAGHIAAMVHASDGGPDGVRKIGQALTRQYGTEAGSIRRINLFASSQLDLALGRSNVIHAALKKGAASEAFLERCQRLALYRRGKGLESSVHLGADDRNQRGGGPDHCQEDQPEQPSGSDDTTSGRGPGIKNL
ncbi:MAG: RNA-binding protein [Beijerinckiaceae bacterium]|nr:RNA-binding protein [Beijerinckiaceae bacterium]MDO9439679.1 RNA-binding protein [Beijerinckiaceae bacterium]